MHARLLVVRTNGAASADSMVFRKSVNNAHSSDRSPMDLRSSSIYVLMRESRAAAANDGVYSLMSKNRNVAGWWYQVLLLLLLLLQPIFRSTHVG